MRAFLCFGLALVWAAVLVSGLWTTLYYRPSAEYYVSEVLALRAHLGWFPNVHAFAGIATGALLAWAALLPRVGSATRLVALAAAASIAFGWIGGRILGPVEVGPEPPDETVLLGHYWLHVAAVPLFVTTAVAVQIVALVRGARTER